MTLEQAMVLVDAISKSPTLQSLCIDMSQNHFGKSGIYTFGKAFAACPNLKELAASMCYDGNRD